MSIQNALGVFGALSIFIAVGYPSTDRSSSFSAIEFEKLDPILDANTDCAEPSEEELKEAKEKLQKLVNREFRSSTNNEETSKKILEKYDTSVPVADKLSKTELENLLSDADIGSWLTRGCWADGIIEKFDSDGDKSLSKDEIKNALDTIGVSAPPAQ